MEHHKHRHAHVDLDHGCIRIGQTVYERVPMEGPQNQVWYRHSRSRVKRNGEETKYVPRHSRSSKYEWQPVRRDVDDRQSEELEGLWRRAEKRQASARQNEVLAAEQRDHKKKHGQPDRHESPNKPAAVDAEIKRDKHGVILHSVGGKFYFGLCLNRSRKYPGQFSVRLQTAGRWFVYTLGKKEMRAFAREVARAFTARELRALLSSSPEQD